MPTRTDDTELARWSDIQPTELTGDPIWKLDAYRHAAYVAALVRTDVAALTGEPVLVHAASQLLRAGTSIAANLAESYGRPTNPDRLRYLSIALGSLRETQTWYQACGLALPAETVNSRLVRLSVLRRILLGLISRLRKQSSARFEGW